MYRLSFISNENTCIACLLFNFVLLLGIYLFIIFIHFLVNSSYLCAELLLPPLSLVGGFHTSVGKLLKSLHTYP